VIFTHELVRYSKATSIFDITKAKLQAIDDAIAICSEKALKDSKSIKFCCMSLNNFKLTLLFAFNLCNVI